MQNTQTTTSGDDKHWTRSDFENLQYIAGYDTSTNPPTPIYKPYPSTVYQKTTVVQDSDGNILEQSEYVNDIVTGFTNPNLHRRVDAHEPEHEDNQLNQELAPREYTLEIKGTNSYRTTTITVHDEESTTTEIP